MGPAVHHPAIAGAYLLLIDAIRCLDGQPGELTVLRGDVLRVVGGLARHVDRDALVNKIAEREWKEKLVEREESVNYSEGGGRPGPGEPAVPDDATRERLRKADELLGFGERCR